MATGALAQLGERLHGMQEVRGSNPLGSKPPFLFRLRETVWFVDVPSSPNVGEVNSGIVFAMNPWTKAVACNRALVLVGSTMLSWPK